MTTSAFGQVSDSDRRVIVGRLVPRLPPNVGIRLFGSRARGDAGMRSDIDLALISSSGISAAVLAEIREVMEEVPIPFRVDVVDYTLAPAELRQAIDREGIEWTG